MGFPVKKFPEFWSTPEAYAFDESMSEIGDDEPPLDAVCGVLGSVSSTSIHCCFRRFQTLNIKKDDITDDGDTKTKTIFTITFFPRGAYVDTIFCD